MFFVPPLCIVPLLADAQRQQASRHDIFVDTIDVDMRFIEDAPQLVFQSPPCATHAPRGRIIDVDARVVADLPALPAPGSGSDA